MKKNILYITGFTMQFFGIGFMLYGLNNNRVLLWCSFPLVLIGLLLITIGVKKNSDKSK